MPRAVGRWTIINCERRRRPRKPVTLPDAMSNLMSASILAIRTGERSHGRTGALRTRIAPLDAEKKATLARHLHAVESDATPA